MLKISRKFLLNIQMSVLLGAVVSVLAQPLAIAQEDSFRDMDDLLPSPNSYRTASGRPGVAYWQQKADYKIDATLDAEAKRILGTLILSYTNNSPEPLDSLWVHLDQNRFSPCGAAQSVSTNDFLTPRGGISPESPSIPIEELQRQQLMDERVYGMAITRLTDSAGKLLVYEVRGTLARVELDRPLLSGQSVQLTIDWTSKLVEAHAFDSRSGYETLDDGSLIVGAGEWFPRVAAYTDARGWHVEQYLGGGEFALEFGTYDVSVTVPENYIVAATGELKNPGSVLTAEQRKRYADATSAKRPLRIVTTAEAAAKRVAEASDTRTWRFKAENVRDFAWAASPAFIWDAMGVHQSDASRPTVMAMSFYPDEGDPLWGIYATEAIAHALETYSRYTFAYPYPTAQAVNGPTKSGMEYPMISFNGPRPENQIVNGERTYSRHMKHRIIGIIVHETGHSYFPMIVNTDERRWGWMDEGINSFLELLSNLSFEDSFDEAARTRDGVIPDILADRHRTLMSTPDSVIFRKNPYNKTAMALFVLRETILGRETFDRAFKAYAIAWKFKRPEPADFFRMMEKESGQDLAWFWRAWFFSTDHVDVAIEDVTRYRLNLGDPETEALVASEDRQEQLLFPKFEVYNRASGDVPREEKRPHLEDFYSTADEFKPGAKQQTTYDEKLENMKTSEREAILREAQKGREGKPDFYTIVRFRNIGGVPTPLPLQLTFEDGSKEMLALPADIWRRSTGSIEKLFVRSKPIVEVAFDPNRETLDTDLSNNLFPQKMREAFLPLSFDEKKMSIK
ncbi:MAG: M1 family metallopeptidase [Planctomycetes bacterium]|nr:M1 family metallopeptidase [Planctomycetota bacterium]